jgi:putative FmdB family regulatory protein
MPTYEYECQKCKKTFEAFQSIKDKPLTKCKFCSGTVKRLISAGGGIIFKGSGFYATDYRKRDYKEKEKKEKPSSCPSQGPACKGCPKAE